MQHTILKLKLVVNWNQIAERVSFFAYNSSTEVREYWLNRNIQRHTSLKSFFSNGQTFEMAGLTILSHITEHALLMYGVP